MIQKNIIFLLLLCFSFQCCAQQLHYDYVPEDAWQLIEPYLMPETHPLKEKLDHIFSKNRVLKNPHTLFKSGFEKKMPQSHTRLIVTRHKKMKGYIFKIYTDDKLAYYRNEPEYITWMLRARGAKILRKEIAKQGWQKYFKAPKKWIYALPPLPKAYPGSLQKNFILVEEEMDTLPDRIIRKKWRDGSITPELLDKLFYLITTTGLRGGCKHDNIPICRDKRIAFIDTQNNLRWPLPYERLLRVLTGELRTHWQELTQTKNNIPRIQDTK